MHSWSSVSYNIKLLRDNQETTKQEHRFLLDTKGQSLPKNLILN